MVSLPRLPEGWIWGSGSLSICVSAEPRSSPLPAIGTTHSKSSKFERCTILCRPQLLKIVLPENVTLKYNVSHFFHSPVPCLLARAMASVSSHLAQGVPWDVWESPVCTRQLVINLFCCEMPMGPKTKQHCSRRSRLRQL